jgi:hypothetical protein
MATVNITYFKPAVIQETAAIIDPVDAVPQSITSSGTSQSTTGTATAGRNYVKVSSSGGDVYLAFGTNPTAVTAVGFVILSGSSEIFHLQDGWKVAVIN